LPAYGVKGQSTAVSLVSVERSIRAFEAGKYVFKAALLLNDYDHVLNVFGDGQSRDEGF
jgi:hypothetical protein